MSNALERCVSVSVDESVRSASGFCGSGTGGGGSWGLADGSADDVSPASGFPVGIEGLFRNGPNKHSSMVEEDNKTLLLGLMVGDVGVAIVV